jgi:predicted DNA-binding transcriptional regulator YafY
MHRTDLETLAPVLEVLRQAVRDHHRVQMDYQSRDQAKPSQREMDPYALVHRWGWWYVIGYCHLREGLRTFRVDRIASLKLLGTPFEVPDDFDLREYLAQEPGTQPLIEVQMHFRPEAARLAFDNQTYWKHLEPQRDGSVLVTFAAPDLIWATSTALAYGPVVEVLSPAEVRGTVIEWAQAVVKSYAEPKTFRLQHKERNP